MPKRIFFKRKYFICLLLEDEEKKSNHEIKIESNLKDSRIEFVCHNLVDQPSPPIINILPVILSCKIISFPLQLDFPDKFFKKGSLEILLESIKKYINVPIILLNLRKNNLEDYDCYIIATHLDKLGSLESLRLSENKITDEGGLVLAQAVMDHQRLEMLDLQGNLISKEGQIQIKKILKKKKKIYLRIGNTE